MKKRYLLIALLVFGIGLLFGQTPPSIDSVWFWEETDCNDSNIVHICYILIDSEGDPANISVQMSADSGATWTVPLVTLIGAESAIGDSVMPGTHCFEWIMSEDLPGVEGFAYTVRFIIEPLEDCICGGDFLKPTGSLEDVLALGPFSSSISFPTNVSYGEGEITSGKTWEKLSTKDTLNPFDFVGSDSLFGFIWFSVGPTSLEWPTGSNSHVFIHFNLCSSSPDTVLLQVRRDDWVKIWIDGDLVWTKLSGNDNMRPIPWGTPPDTVRMAFEPGEWHRVFIAVINSGNNNWSYATCFKEPETGEAAYWLQYSLDPGDFGLFLSDTFYAYGYLDSRSAEVDISCPTFSIMAGDSHAFDWIVDDLFFTDDPCSLHFLSGPCGIDESYTATGGSYYWSVPIVDCSACTLVVAARDSFCNWGYDTCVFEIEIANLPPSIDSVWFWEETDCNDSNIVHICYILSDPEGDPATISVQISADSGATWTVPLSTLLNDAADLGDSIMPGTHCFDWIMNEDMPDSEGYDFSVLIEYSEIIETGTCDLTAKWIGEFDGHPHVLTFNEHWLNDTLIAVDSVWWPTICSSIDTGFYAPESSFIYLKEYFAGDCSGVGEFFGYINSRCDSIGGIWRRSYTTTDWFAIRERWDSQSEFSPLDSDPPTVFISCPTSSVIAGDSYAFDWIVDELFFDDDPCSVYFFSGPCGIDESYTATGGSYSWSVPMVNCAACTLVIAARDSFCNWGYDTCVFEIEIANLPPSIDSVWFWEETDCNDSNIVHICYILSDPEGDPATISVQMSADSGATWTVPLETLIGAESAIGDSIYPGTHCFQWIMSEDMLDSEGYDWMLEISFELVSSCPCGGDSIRKTGSLEDVLVLGPFGSGFTFPKDISYKEGDILGGLSWENFTTVDTINPFDMSGADSLWGLIWFATGPHSHGWPTYSGGHLYIHFNVCSSSPESTLMQVRRDDWVEIWIDGDLVWSRLSGADNMRPFPLGSLPDTVLLSFDENEWHNVFIAVINNGYNWSYATCFMDRFTGEKADWIRYSLDPDSVYSIFTDSIIATGPLDSRPPDVSISCPSDTLFSGDTAVFHWTIDDLFWANDECTLFIDYCEGVDTILLTDTLHSWIAPGVMCDSAWVRIAVRDSFCNWGYDSCSFTIFGDMEPVIVISGFPWENAYSACDTLNIWWLLYDGSGIDTLTAMVSINDDTLAYPHPLLSWNGDTLFYELVTAMFPDTITACLLECDDIWGNPLAAPPYCMTFFNDLGAPIVLDYGPEMTGDLSPLIWASAVDSGSGVDETGFTFRIDGTDYDYTDAGFSWSSDSFYFDCAVVGLSFGVGDTIDVCITASDRPDLCNANMTDTCWTVVFADTVPPEVSLLYPPESSISACEDQAIIWLFSDIGLGIDTSSVVVTIDGDISDIGLTWSADTLTFVPDTNWAEGTHTACVIAGADLWGLELVDDSVCVEFEIDLTPPTISILTPLCGSVSGDTLADIVALIEDSPAGVWWQSAFIAIESDTFWFDSLYHSGDTLILSPESFGLVWSDDDTIHFCIGAADSADFCTGDNFADSCCAFHIDASGPWATLVSPPDGVISSCEYQSVIWILYGDPLDGTIRVDVNGMIYDLTDAELSRNLDTLIFTPITSWSSADNITACLVEMEDTFGNELSDSVCVDFTIDLDPPVFSSFDPSPGEIIDNPLPLIALFIEDLIAGLNLDSLILIIDGDIVTHVFDAGTLSFDSEGTYTFGGGDTVEICTHAADLAELCGANSSDTCWTFYIATGGPVVTPIYPNPLAISACDDQGAIFVFSDSQGIDEATVWATIDGTAIDFWTFADDTVTITPPSGYFAHGDTAIVCAGGSDMLGNAPDSVSCITYIIDLEPPVYIDFYPACGESVQNMSPEISFGIYDTLAGVDSSSVWVSLNGITIPATFDGATATWTPDSNFFPNQWVGICVGAGDNPDLCDPNESDTCCSFYILDYPDLWPENLGFEPSSPVEEGTEITFFGLVFNDLIQDVEDFTVCVLQDGMNIGTIPISGLLLGESDSVGWPLSLPEGEYQLCFFADCDSTIIESNETNNIACLDLVVLGALCDVHPNPFTPNADGSNDEAKFEYPGQGNTNATIKIFDMQNRFIKEIPDNISVWDGTDSGGNKMPRGVYLYLVLSEDKVLCKGTVYLGR